VAYGHRPKEATEVDRERERYEQEMREIAAEQADADADEFEEIERARYERERELDEATSQSDDVMSPSLRAAYESVNLLVGLSEGGADDVSSGCAHRR